MEPTKQPLLDQLRKPGGLALSFAGIALSLVSIVILPTRQLPAQWLIIVFIVAVASICISQAAIRKLQADLTDAIARAQPAELAVIQARVAPPPESEVILLLRPNRIFGHAMLVSIYYDDENQFELYIAAGSVTNIQSNGLIQITVTCWEPAYDHIRGRIVAQEPNHLKRVLVRPAPAISSAPALSRTAIFEAFASNLQEGSIK